MIPRTGLLLLVPLLVARSAAQSPRPDGMLQGTVADLLADSANIHVDRSLKTDLADRTSRDLREAPGIVHVITRQELMTSGAQTLQEAMLLVPGVSLGRDVDDVVGLGIRGNWAEEGKCLVMLDGIPLNETSYGTAGLALQLPVENVERIEVINGPGSVMYGGFAALGVVNVITRDAGAREGTELTAMCAVASDRIARSRTSVLGSHRLSELAQVNYSLSMVQEVLSARTAERPDGTMVDYANASGAQAFTGQIGFSRRKLRAQFFLGDRIHRISDRSISVHLRNATFRFENSFDLGRHASIICTGSMSWMLPWNYLNDTTWSAISLNTADQRTSASAVWRYAPRKWIRAQAGIQGWYDTYRLSDPLPGQEFNIVPGQHFSIHDLAGFLEVSTHASWGNVILGFRAEHQSMVGQQYAPRIAYTALFGKFHFKALAAKAFKLPTMANIESGPDGSMIASEQVNTLEAEAGFRPNAHVQVALSAFRVDMRDPIVFVFDEETLDSYLNRECAATQGLELSARGAAGKFGAYTALSMYESLSDPADLPEVALPEDCGPAFQGMPRYKAVALLHARFSTLLQPEIAAIWQSRAHAYQFTAPEAMELGLAEYGSTFTVNAGLRASCKRLPGLELRLGISDALDAGARILSPYNNGSDPLPGRGREWTCSVRYTVPL